MTTRVLVVEDEPLVRMLAVDLVDDAGLEALEACNADDAIEVLSRTPDIGILMTDINMPGSMDGLKLAEVARTACPSIEIVVVSGRQSLDPGKLPERSVFLPKPYDIHKLSQLLLKMAA